MSGYLTGLEGDVLSAWRKKSQKILYQTDPEAWLWDMLGRKWWSMQREIAWSFVENEFTIVKSCNGVGKTQEAGDLTGWFASVFEPEETNILLSAPVRNQIDENLFGYLRANMYEAKERGNPFLGEITRWPKWIVKKPFDHDLVLPKRPADQNLISSFQGVHNVHVAVILDEAGGLQEDFYIGANAVTTNEHARIFAIGNPDVRNTAFHRRFSSANIPDQVMLELPSKQEIEDDEVYYDPATGHWWRYGDQYRDWHRFTIGAKDTPNFTGEMIYPEDLEKDAAVKAKLVKVGWAAMMRRSASTSVVAAKVDGEFPTEGDDTFFTQRIINKAWNTFSEMKEAREAEANQGRVVNRPRFLGVDVAFTGEDKNVVYLNDGGMITKIDEWDKGGPDGEAAVEEIAIARRVHKLALLHSVTEVRIDAAGTSRGVHQKLLTSEEFEDRYYTLYGIIGNNKSPDKNKFLNARAWHFESFRSRMQTGDIGIDMADSDLRTDLESLGVKYTTKSQLQIFRKDELRKLTGHSPDHLDAAIYSAIDYTGLTEGADAGAERGDVIVVDPFDLVEYEYGMPM